MQSSNKRFFSSFSNDILAAFPLKADLYLSYSELNYLAMLPCNQRTKEHTRLTAEEKAYCDGAQHGIFWKILFWFEHCKCTHIDRCSRLLFPSPANREHTQNWLLHRLRGARGNIASSFLRLFACHPLLCLFLFSGKKNLNYSTKQGHTDKWRRNNTKWRWMTTEKKKNSDTKTESIQSL